MTTLYLLRHGETHWNVEQRMQGRGDSALTERGLQQAARHGELLARLGGVDELLVSPSGRTRQTADIVRGRLEGAGLSTPVTYHDVLMERHSGEWEGLTLTEIRARYPEDWQARDADPWSHRPPGGENHADLERRVAPLLDALEHRAAAGLRSVHPERTANPAGTAPGPERIAIVTHGIMSRVILKRLLDLGPDEAVTLRHPNALFYRLEYTDAGVRHSHFLDGAGPFAGLLRH